MILTIVHPWLAQIKTTGITLNHTDFKPNNATLTNAEHTLQVHPLATNLPHQPWFTLGWYMPQLRMLMVISGIHKLLTLSVTTHHSTFAILFHRKYCGVKTKNSEWLMWESYTLSNDTSDFITHCIHRQIFRARRKWYLWEKETCSL